MLAEPLHDKEKTPPTGWPIPIIRTIPDPLDLPFLEPIVWFFFGQREPTRKVVVRAIANTAIVLLLVEYTFVALIFWLSYHTLVTFATVFEVFFLVIEILTECVLYKALGLPFRGKFEKKIVGIDVSGCRLRSSLFKMVTMAPNYLHVVQCALIAGRSYKTWETYDLQSVFEKNWVYWGAVGRSIGDLGLPKILTSFLVVSMGMHLLLAICFKFFEFSCPDETAAEICDCANLQFLGQAVKHVEEVVVSRESVDRVAADLFANGMRSTSGPPRSNTWNEEMSSAVPPKAYQYPIDVNAVREDAKAVLPGTYRKVDDNLWKEACGGPRTAQMGSCISQPGFSMDFRATEVQRTTRDGHGVQPALLQRAMTAGGVSGWRFRGPGNKDVYVLNDRHFEALFADTVEPQSFQLARLVFAATIKLLFLWAKTSLTSLLWRHVGILMKVELVFALLLAWYGIAQQLPSFSNMFRTSFDRVLLVRFCSANHSWCVRMVRSCLVCPTCQCVPALIMCLVVCLVFGLSVVGLHTIGIAVCESGDLSIVHGCT